MSRLRVAIGLSLVSVASSAAEPACDLDLGALVGYAINFRAHALGVADEPLQSPPSSQAAAATTNAADDPVPDASFPALVAMNYGIPTSSTDSGAMTFDLTPFALVAVLNPDVIHKQSEYAKYDSLRKIGAALTLGGRGEAFDRDGDGQVDEALESQDMSDVVSFEIRYRFVGSRDRRDEVNEQKYFGAVGGLFDPAAAAFADVASRIASSAPAPRASGFCMADAEAMADAHARQIDPAVKVVQAYLDARQQVLEEIDGAAIWTAVAGATEQKDTFGPDRWWLGVRGAGGLGPDMGWSVTVDYGKTSALVVGGDTKRIKAGAEWSSLIGKQWVSPGQGGVRASLSAAYEKWSDARGSADDNVASVNIKFSYPLTDTIQIPLSLTWASKSELLQDESEVRGYIGFTFDFDGALRKALGIDAK